MMWQIDESPYACLEDRGPQLTLHAIIDDATGEVIAAVFRPTEALEGYVAVMIEGLRRKGVPLALYSDRHSIFPHPKANGRSRNSPANRRRFTGLSHSPV